MKNLKTIISFELKNYFTNKAFMISTIIIALIAILAMFVPRVFNIFDNAEDTDSADAEQTPAIIYEEDDVDNSVYESGDAIALYDAEGTISDELLAAFFPGNVFIRTSDRDSVISLVESLEAKAGFVVDGQASYEYFVFNKSMYNSDNEVFYQLMQISAQMKYCEEHGLNFEEISSLSQMDIAVHEEVLGKDSMSNFWYCYALVILIFMLIILYGTMIATSVTVEKSNRSIEVLVTSTNPTSLLFGKVFAGAIASLLQCGIVLGGVLLSYQINRDAWGGSLDNILNIPPEVLITFAVFGLGGYLFYAFLYGMMGALVSKTEDINKTAGTVQMIIMIVYFIVLFQLQNVDGTLIKVASFLPFSSYSAMFARVAMGSVSIAEIIISAVILIASIIGAGFLGAKVYRISTLRYGNPLKLTAVLKSIKQQD